MIERPSIIITSIGRTGTEFFANFFANLIPNSTSLHEPDIVKFPGVDNKVQGFIEQVRQAGIWRMVILKALGKWTLIRTSDARFQRKLSKQQAALHLDHQRRSFISEMPGYIYIESNSGYYGLLDVLPNVFAIHRTIYIVRDGRDWIRSAHNWGEIYGKKGLRRLFSHSWPTAKDVKGDPLADQWDSFSRFEKLCWTWSRLNEFAIGGLVENRQAQLFHFEKIFIDENKYEYLDGLITFATSVPGIDSTLLGSYHSWLERKIHASADGFPVWEKWSIENKRSFEKICGPLMEKLGYSF